MSSRGSAKYRFNYGRGGTSRNPITNTKRDRSPSPDVDELPLGDLVVELHPADISPSDGLTHISNYKCIASYNWLDSSEPVILVPGSPAIWSPPAHRRKLEPDKGEVFIDQNAARYGSFPLEPMFRAIYEVHPALDLEDVDVVICRNTMGKLFDFVTTNSRRFEIDVEIIGDKAVFIRKERKATEFIDEFRGFGHTFPEEYTRWDSAVKGSSSHHRIAEYEFAGLKYLLRFQSDGYLAETVGGLDKASSWRQGNMAGLANTTTLLSFGNLTTIGEKRPMAGHGLTVRRGGSESDQEAMIEIKTRAAHKVLDMESVLPRLWMSQTPNLIAAYHKGGRFDDVQILDVRKDLGKWEERNSVNLRKLDALTRRIIDTAQHSTTRKCRVKRTASGELEIWELNSSHQSALPDDLRHKLKKKDLEGENDLEAEDDRSKEVEQGSPERDSGDYDDFDDDDQRYDEEDDSDKDFTACSLDDCGYCGHCSY